MKRTTIVADEDLLLEIREIARRQKRSASGVIREALDQYIERQRSPKRHLAWAGKARSGRTDVSARAEELIKRGVKK